MRFAHTRWESPSMRLGIRANLEQFALLVFINVFVGATLGLERTLVPLIAREEFGITSDLTLLAFIAAFGLAKAPANLLAGRLQQSIGRKRTLILGWLIAVPVPWMLMFGSWSWIVAANVLLGISQGLAWSSTVVMKVDIAGSRRRGLAVGLNESAGYLALGITAWLTADLAATYGLRPVPFYPGIAFTIIGLLLSLFVRETLPLAEENASMPGEQRPEASRPAPMRSLWTLGQAGLATNFNDVLMWGVLPLMLAANHFSLASIAVIVAIYPAVWAVLQLGSGTLSDRIGTTPLIAGGMATQAIALAILAFAHAEIVFVLSSTLLGVGTAMSYPTLLAAVGHKSTAATRSRAFGYYRFWRDMGFVVGATVVSFGLSAVTPARVFLIVALLTLLSGVVVWTITPRSSRSIL